MSTPTPSERVKANRLRAKVKIAPSTIDPADAEWLNDYESKQEAQKESKGASRAHKVSYSEESVEAAGTGSAAEVAVAAVMVREEGRRYDAMLDRVILATDRACALHERMAEALLKRAIEDGETIRAMSKMWRENFLEKTELEADAIRAAGEEGGDEISKMAATLLPQLLPAIMAHLGKDKKAPKKVKGEPTR